jgi:hypothetical protein
MLTPPLSERQLSRLAEELEDILRWLRGASHNLSGIGIDAALEDAVAALGQIALVSEESEHPRSTGWELLSPAL